MWLPEDAIPTTAHVFEKLRGDKLDDSLEAEIGYYGLTDVDPDALMRELQRLILCDTRTDGQTRSPCYWALGKKRDESLLSFFRPQLAVELDRDMFAAYQIMIALQDMGEKASHPSRRSLSSSDDEVNRADAMRYLKHVRAESLKVNT